MGCFDRVCCVERVHDSVFSPRQTSRRGPILGLLCHVLIHVMMRMRMMILLMFF